MTPPALSGYRLSPRQRRLWRTGCASRASQVQCAVTLPTGADEGQLRAAFERFVNRELIFRSSFQLLPGMAAPVLTPEPGAPARWRVIDNEAAPDALLLEERSYDLDFQRGPLLRACLVRRCNGSRVLALSAPSLCADMATLALLVQEIAGSSRQGSASYEQFTEWLNEMLESEDGRVAARHWDSWKPAHRQPARPLSTCRKPRAASRRDSVRSPSVLNIRQLQRRAADLGVSREAILLACWRIMLGRLTAGDDPSIGVTLPGRDHESLAATAGPVACCAPVPGIQSGGLLEASFAQVVSKPKSAFRTVAIGVFTSRPLSRMEMVFVLLGSWGNSIISWPVTRSPSDSSSTSRPSRSAKSWMEN